MVLDPRPTTTLPVPIAEYPMNRRLALIILPLTVMLVSSGCAPFRNFFFGQGARCGMGSRISAPFQKRGPVAAPAPCQSPAPTYVQPLSQPCGPHPCAPQAPCGCGPHPCESYSGSSYVDPYLNTVVPGQPLYDGFQPRATPSYQSNYPGYGYKVDERGDRIIYEEPLPNGAVSR